MIISDQLEALIKKYECVHIEHVTPKEELDIWGKTLNPHNLINEHSKDIYYDDGINRLIIKSAMHTAVINEKDVIIIEGFIPSRTVIRPSRDWEDGVTVIFEHTNNATTSLDFFN